MPFFSRIIKPLLALTLAAAALSATGCSKDSKPAGSPSRHRSRPPPAKSGERRTIACSPSPRRATSRAPSPSSRASP